MTVRSLALTALLVACKREGPRLEPTPFDDILPGFEDPGTYEAPTHSVWTLDEPDRFVSALAVYDFDGDGRVELAVGGSTNGGWEDAGTTSGVYWPEDVTTGGALEDQRQIVWQGVERNVGTWLSRIGRALVVGSTPWPLAPTPQGERTFVYEAGWRATFEEANYALEVGGPIAVDWNDDGVTDLVGRHDGVAGPVGPDAEATWSWDRGLLPGRVQDGLGWVALDDGDIAFVPKPLPAGHIPSFTPWSWDGPQVGELGPYVAGFDAWMARRFDADAVTAIHPERGALYRRFVSMHDGINASTKVVEGDFDGDGAPELVMASGEAVGERFVFVSVFRFPLIDFASEEDAWVRLHLPAGAQYVLSMQAADVDGDGRDDLFVAYALRGTGQRVVVVTADDLLDRVPPVE
jgi:hypothetical protein